MFGFVSRSTTAFDFKKVTTRDPFSDYLPWEEYSEDAAAFLLHDDHVGYLWECIPVAFASSRTLKAMESLFGIAYPKGTVGQVILHADPHIDPILDAYADGVAEQRRNPMAEKTKAEMSAFLKSGQTGLGKNNGIPIRNFRLFFTLYNKEPISDDILTVVAENLRGAGLNPTRMPIRRFMGWMRRLYNTYEEPPLSVDNYDPAKSIRRQIINADTPIRREPAKSKTEIYVGDHKVVRILTPQSYPNSEFDAMTTNVLTGGIRGPHDDLDQITSEFLWTLVFLTDDLQSTLKGKAAATFFQKGGAKFGDLRKRIDEYTHVMDSLDNTTHIAVIPIITIIGQSESQARRAAARARRLWELNGHTMHEETTLALPLFIMAQPFGFYHEKGVVEQLQRHYYPSLKTAATIAPIQADYRGNVFPDHGVGKPKLVYVGRKGQLCGLDLLAKGSTNSNFCVFAGSGGGKSFTVNALVQAHYDAGAKIRLTDLGYSYLKTCKINHGRYIDVGRDDIVMNPFLIESTSQDADDFKGNIDSTVNVLGEMVYSSTGQAMTEVEYSILKQGVRQVFKHRDMEHGIDAIREFLFDFKGSDKLEKYTATDEMISRATEMAFNLTDYASKGDYGRFFNGNSTFDIAHDDFVILELESLIQNEELFRVISLQVLNSITADLYLSERDKRRFIVFEEAGVVFNERERLARIANEGYRRARKYGGGFGIVTQSVEDTVDFGKLGRVMMANSAYKLFLEAKDYRKVAEAGLINIEGLALELLEGVTAQLPNYSEIFADTPMGKGVMRFIVDNWSYWMYTSTAEEVAQFNHLIEQKGMSDYDALCALSGR